MKSAATTHETITATVRDARAEGCRVAYDPNDAGTLEIWDGERRIYWAVRKDARTWIIRFDPAYFIS